MQPGDQGLSGTLNEQSSWSAGYLPTKTPFNVARIPIADVVDPYNPETTTDQHFR
jgi:hypothetical protein